jgi:hypothetical protein
MQQQPLLLSSPAAPDQVGLQQQQRAGAAADRRFWLTWLGFFVLGTVNNLPYVVVGSAAKAIAGHYCELNLIGAVTWANVGCGFLAKVSAE